MNNRDFRQRKYEIEKILRSATPLLLEGYTPRPGGDNARRTRLGTANKSSFRDIVTVYDKNVEAFLTEALHESFPGEVVIGEEDSATQSQSIRERCAGLDGFWLIDPIDGTTNYSRAYPFFCSTMAYVQKNQAGVFEVVSAATWQPVAQEMFSAALGSGAWLDRDRISVTQVQDPEAALLSTGFASERSQSADRPFDLFKQLTKLTLGVRRDGAAALDLAYVAIGRTDAYWESGLSPWDTAAGILLVQEAGGKVSHHNGEPVDIFSGEVLSSNSFLHKWLQEKLKIG